MDADDAGRGAGGLLLGRFWLALLEDLHFDHVADGNHQVSRAYERPLAAQVGMFRSVERSGDSSRVSRVEDASKEDGSLKKH